MKACRPIPPERRQCACGCRAWFTATYSNETYVNTQHRLWRQSERQREKRAARRTK